MDDNERFIQWGDEIIKGANHLGHVNEGCFKVEEIKIEGWLSSESKKIANWVKKTSKENNQDVDKELERYLQGIKNHLLSEWYLDEPKQGETFWRLTDTGKLVKELDGHFNYKKYRSRQLNALAHQSTVNWALLIIGLLSFIVPVLVGTCNDKPYPKEIRVILPDSCCTRIQSVQQPLVVQKVQVGTDSSKQTITTQQPLPTTLKAPPKKATQ